MAGPIYTRQGDAGQTVLGAGQRVPKDHPLVVVLGDLDELNSHLGVVRAITTAGAEDAQQHAVATALVRYLNRLSDWLFVAARWVNRQEGVRETPWGGLPLS